MTHRKKTSETGLEHIIENLQSRIGTLQSQYKDFVGLCTNLIKFHRKSLDDELKSDPNTPREVIRVINKHSENLEKHFIEASNLRQSSIHLNDSDLLERFRDQLLQIIDRPISNSNKKLMVSKSIEELNLLLSVESTKKNTDQKQQRFKSDKLLHIPEIESSEIFTENNKLRTEINMLNSKIIDLKIKLNEKDSNFQELNAKLERIKRLQEVNVSVLKSQYINSDYKIQANVNSNPISPNSELKKNYGAEKNQDFQVKFLGLQEKLNFLAGLLRNISKNTSILENIFKSESPELKVLFQNYQKETYEIEKTIDEIITPRFNGADSEKPPKGKSNEKMMINRLNSEIKNLKQKIEILENENYESNIRTESLMNENNELKVIVSANKQTFNGLEKEIESLKKKIQITESEVNELNKSNKLLQSKNKNLEEILDENSKEFYELQTKESEKIQTECKNYEKVIEDLKTHQKISENEVQELKLLLKISKQNFASFEKESSSLKKHAAALESEVTDLKNNIKSLRDDSAKIESELGSSKLTIVYLEKERENLQTQLKNSKILIEDNNQTIENLSLLTKTLEKKIGLLTEEIVEIGNENKRLLETREKLINECNNQAEELAQMKFRLDQSRIFQEDSIEIDVQLEGFKDQNRKSGENHLQRSLNELQAENKTLCIALEEIMNSNKLLEQELHQTKAKVVIYNETQEIEKLCERNNELELFIKTLNSEKTTEIRNLFEKIQILEEFQRESELFYNQEIEGYQKSIEEYLRTIEKNNTEISNLKLMIAEITNHSSSCAENADDYKIVRAVTHENKTWYLLRQKESNTYVWSDSEMKTDIKDLALEFFNDLKLAKEINKNQKIKLAKLENFLKEIQGLAVKYKYSEILMVLNNNDLGKQIEENRSSAVPTPRDNIFTDEYSIDLISPRNIEKNDKQIVKETSILFKGDESMLNDSLFQENYELHQEIQKLVKIAGEKETTIDELQKNIEKNRTNMVEKQNIIEKYENNIIQLKEKLNEHMSTNERFSNAKNILENYLNSHPNSQKEIPILEPLCAAFDIVKKQSRIPKKLKK